MSFLSQLCIVNILHQVVEPPQKSAKTPSRLKAMREKVRSRSQHGSGDPEADGIERSAIREVEDYLSHSDSDDTEDTFTFWRQYSKSGNKIRKHLARLAQIYLTPAPTSTDVERLGCDQSNQLICSLCYYFPKTDIVNLWKLALPVTYFLPQTLSIEKIGNACTFIKMNLI